MKTTFYLNDKKVTRKALKELLGEDRLNNIIAEAKEGYRKDPLEELSWFVGKGMLAVEFS